MILARDFSGGGLTLAAGWEYAAIPTTPISTSFDITWNIQATVLSSFGLSWNMDAEGEILLAAIQTSFNIGWIYQVADAIPARNLMLVKPDKE